MTAPWATLLAGVVGSHAYGLAHADSDVDRFAVAAAPTASLLGLRPPTERELTVQSHEPDVVTHEAVKFCRLALKCNPSVLEALYLTDYEVLTPFGASLVERRDAFLSATAVRNAFLGYADGQFERLEAAGRFAKVPVSRIEKHSRHLHRLCVQGLELYATGTLTVRLADPQVTIDFGKQVAADPAVAQAFLVQVEDQFDAARTPLPSLPSETLIESWLLDVRAAHYTPPEVVA